jgi:hypothetical protein
MGVDLSRIQRADHHDQGQVTCADSRAHARRGTKAKRSVTEGLIAAGAPLVLDMWSRGQLEWFDGTEALQAWQEVRPYVVTGPTTKQLSKHKMWTACVWEPEDGAKLLYLTGRC